MFDLDRIDWLPVVNDSGETIPPFAVMRIYDVETDKGKTRFLVRKPNSDFLRKGYLINGPGKIPIAGTGSGHRGRGFAMTDPAITAPAGEESWGATVDEWFLSQHRSGFYMLGNPQERDGSRRGLVEPYEVKTLRGTLDGTMSVGGSQTLQVTFRDGGSWTASGYELTVYDDLLPTGGSLASGTVVIAYWFGDRWWAQEARCPVTP